MAALPDDQPSIVVIDELPWLLESDEALEGELQTTWDRGLSRKPVLLILIGLVTGGLPLICQEWRHGSSLREFLRSALGDPTSALLVSGERSLAAEFPAEVQARTVLAAIGNGERTWKGITSELTDDDGRPIADSSLGNALRRLEAKRVIAVDVPLSAKSGERDKRYRVADPYLRFYLAFLRDGLPLVERGRGDIVLLTIDRSWGTWHERAVEPVIREALLRIASDLGYPEVAEVGGWWNRRHNPEIDIVAKSDARNAAISFAGSIKWHEKRGFGRREYADLLRDVRYVPGADEQTPLLAVTRTGTADDAVPIRCLGPDDVLGAWRDVTLQGPRERD
ncbi:MAG TPA: DUF234 domain-containing protein [Trebonia sp.]|nr:DUF234 domain-containing protein [Trebonia sp.]